VVVYIFIIKINIIYIYLLLLDFIIKKKINKGNYQIYS